MSGWHSIAISVCVMLLQGKPFVLPISDISKIVREMIEMLEAN